MSNLNRTVTVTIGPNDYDIPFPNTGQILDIEVLKLSITRDKFEQFKFSFNPTFQKQALVAETVATFNTLIPKLKKDLAVDSMLDLPMEQMDSLVKVYQEVYLPWYEEWLTQIAKSSVKASE